MDQKELATLITILVLTVLVAIIIALFTVFVRRKNKMVMDQFLAKKAYEHELAVAQVEISEATLRNISWELHDNIGQLMTLAKIQVQQAGERPENIAEAAETIGQGINELRALSKLINPESLKSLTLREAIQLEIERFNRLKFIESSLKVNGLPISIDTEREIIVFRILQEFFSNTIKHSKATQLDVLLDYSDSQLSIKAVDNGVGFEFNSDFAGIGLKNMKSRAQLIEAHLEIISEKGKGTTLNLEYRF